MEPPALAAQGSESLADWTDWVDRRWAACPAPLALAAGRLDPSQRLLLGLVAFARVSYQQVSACLGLEPRDVAGACSSALRLLSARVDTSRRDPPFRAQDTT